MPPGVCGPPRSISAHADHGGVFPLSPHPVGLPPYGLAQYFARGTSWGWGGICYSLGAPGSGAPERRLCGYPAPPYPSGEWSWRKSTVLPLYPGESGAILGVCVLGLCRWSITDGGIQLGVAECPGSMGGVVAAVSHTIIRRMI